MQAPNAFVMSCNRRFFFPLLARALCPQVDVHGPLHILLHILRAQPQRRTGRWTRFSWRERGRAVHCGRDSSARARVAATDGNEAVLPPRYTFLVLFQRLFVDINLSSCHDWSPEDGGRRRACSVGRCVARPTYLGKARWSRQQTGWHAAGRLNLAWGVVLWELAHSWKIEISEKECCSQNRKPGSEGVMISIL